MTLYEYRVQFVRTQDVHRNLAPYAEDLARLIETTLNEDTPDFARQGWEPWQVIPQAPAGFMIVYRRPRS